MHSNHSPSQLLDQLPRSTSPAPLPCAFVRRARHLAHSCAGPSTLRLRARGQAPCAVVLDNGRVGLLGKYRCSTARHLSPQALIPTGSYPHRWATAAFSSPAASSVAESSESGFGGNPEDNTYGRGASPASASCRSTRYLRSLSVCVRLSVKRCGGPPGRRTWTTVVGAPASTDGRTHATHAPTHARSLARLDARTHARTLASSLARTHTRTHARTNINNQRIRPLAFLAEALTT